MNFSMVVAVLIPVLILSHQASSAALNAKSGDDASLVLAEARGGSYINIGTFKKITSCLAKEILGKEPEHLLEVFFDMMKTTVELLTKGPEEFVKMAELVDQLRKDLTEPIPGNPGKYDYLGGLERFCDADVWKPAQIVTACKAQCVLDILG